MGLLEKRVDTRRRVPVDKMRHFSSFFNLCYGKNKKNAYLCLSKREKKMIKILLIMQCRIFV